MKPKIPKDGQTARPVPETIESLAALEDICRQMLYWEGRINQQPVKIPYRRLTPKESAEVDLIAMAAMPPLIPGVKPGDERYDLTNKAYRESSALNKISARAVAIYLACPLFNRELPGLTDRNKITEFVQSKLTDVVLQELFDAILGGVVEEVASRTNFT